MKTKKTIGAGAVSAAAAVGMIFASPAQAASIIDLPQPGGNTVQVSTGPGIVAPQFSLWPIPNQAHNVTTGNDAVDRGNNTAGQAFLFGFGAGNVIQFATGGNIIAPQVALGTDNNAYNETNGNFANHVGDESTSDSTGQTGQGLLIDGNGNVFQVAFLQGNIIAPQVAVLGDNNSTDNAYGNYAYNLARGSTTDANDGFAFVTGNGNVIQIEILSDNVIAPQLTVGGNNDIVAFSGGNVAAGAGDYATTNVNGSNPLAGVFAVTGNGNVTHIAILSNNVFAPQIAPFGKNKSDIATDVNDSVENGNNANTTGDTVPVVTHPVLDPVRSTLNTITGSTNRPVLNAIQNALPHNQFGNGNSQQTASGSGAISNPQIGGPTLSAPIHVAAPVVNPLVRNSLVAKPTTLAGGNNNISGGNSGSTTSTSTAKPSWKPGDGIKKVVSSVTNALKPKPNPADKPAT